MKNLSLSISVYFLFIVLLTSCGGGGSSSSDTTSSSSSTSSTAYFIDSGVAGLSFSSPSHQGETDANGGFTYTAGETTTFSFQGLTIGSILTPSGTSSVTPLNLFSTTDVNNQSVKNTLVLLQSLDSDQNASNGISISSAFTITGISSLNISDANFQSSLATSLSNSGISSIVTETTALEHFNDTLLKANASVDFVGQWVMRNARDGNINGLITFAENQTLTSVEYDNCSSGFWGASSSSAERNCSTRNLSMTWSLAGKTLTMTNGSTTDSCTVFSSTAHTVEANCTYQGSGLGSEITRFERIYTELSDSLISTSYREIGLGTTGYTVQTFNTDKSGGYVLHNTSGVAQSGNEDVGSFAWSTTGSKLTISGTDNGATAFTNEWTLQNQQKGTIAVSIVNTDGNSVGALLADFNDKLNGSVIEQTIYGVYDANTGACKELYYFNTSDSNSIVLRKESNANTNSDICSYSSAGLTPEANDAGVFIINKTNGAFVITGSSDNEVCWPISHSTLTTASGYAELACSTSASTEVELEIWKGL